MRRFLVLMAGVLAIVLIGCEDGAQDKEPQVEQPSGELTIDLKRHEVKVKARICLTRGILEFVTVMKGGREHEAIFNTTCRPSSLHAALLGIGLEPHPVVAGSYEDALKSKGRLKFEVEFEKDGKGRRVEAHKLLHNRETDNGKTKNAWVFAGSYFTEHQGKSVYAADHSDVVISIIPDSAAVIQLAVKSGNPYEGDNFGIEVKPDEMGSLEQEVTLIVSPWRDP